MAKMERKEKNLRPTNGMLMLIIFILGILACTFWMVSSFGKGEEGMGVIAALIGYLGIPILMAGLKVINPNTAAVYALFGKYYGTLTQEGFYWIHPFVSIQGKKVSLKAATLNNEKQKVNDKEGNPIEIGVVVIWRVVDPTKAVLDVDNYYSYISTQSDASIRQVARQYPYDISEDGDEKSLRGSAQEVSLELQRELQKRAEIAGLEIIEARIAHLAYAPEIAAAMLQRQQASAIIAARQKIVEGAVGMVEMALNKLSENNVVELDEERRAQMVSNLLVVLCGNKDPQPIVNSGSIY